EVIRLQNTIIDEKKQGLPGKEVEILLEGRSERNPDHYLGRTRKNWLAIVPSKGVSKGEVIIARVVKATRWMLTCEAASGKVGAQS
ncbi:MAG TPA: TRAM domain-containing protein, partial [Firmicutes bacterium]|nr:TRAM domain-containing protein [Bacillota bacterium]